MHRYFPTDTVGLCANYTNIRGSLDWTLVSAIMYTFMAYPTPLNTNGKLGNSTKADRHGPMKAARFQPLIFEIFVAPCPTKTLWVLSCLARPVQKQTNSATLDIAI
jgi:hypothetical protein